MIKSLKFIVWAVKLNFIWKYHISYISYSIFISIESFEWIHVWYEATKKNIWIANWTTKWNRSFQLFEIADRHNKDSRNRFWQKHFKLGLLISKTERRSKIAGRNIQHNKLKMDRYIYFPNCDYSYKANFHSRTESLYKFTV